MGRPLHRHRIISSRLIPRFDPNRRARRKELRTDRCALFALRDIVFVRLPLHAANRNRLIDVLVRTPLQHLVQLTMAPTTFGQISTLLVHRRLSSPRPDRKGFEAVL